MLRQSLARPQRAFASSSAPLHSRSRFALRSASSSSTAPASASTPSTTGPSAADAQPPATPAQRAKELLASCSQAAALPLAAAVMRAPTSGNGELLMALSKAVDIYLVVLTLRVILTWFNTINWRSEPFNMLRQMTDPFLNLFRGLIPPLGGIDLSVMLGFMGLQFLARFLRNAALGMA